MGEQLTAPLSIRTNLFRGHKLTGQTRGRTAPFDARAIDLGLLQHYRPGEICSGEIGANETRTREIGPQKLYPTEIGAIENSIRVITCVGYRLPEIGPQKISVVESDPMKFCQFKLGRTHERASEDCRGETRAGEICPGEICPSEFSLIEICSGEIGLFQIGRPEIRAKEVHALHRNISHGNFFSRCKFHDSPDAWVRIFRVIYGRKTLNLGNQLGIARGPVFLAVFAFKVEPDDPRDDYGGSGKLNQGAHAGGTAPKPYPPTRWVFNQCEESKQRVETPDDFRPCRRTFLRLPDIVITHGYNYGERSGARQVRVANSRTSSCARSSWRKVS